LIVEEEGSRAVVSLLAADPSIATWWGSDLECVSALRRRERESSLSSNDLATALALLDELAGAWHEVLPGAELRAVARRALALHPLRAADSLQMAAALIWRGSAADVAELVSLDDRLRDAAGREGFRVSP